MKQESYHRLISGESDSLTASLLHLFLAVAAAAYSIGIRLRNFLYSNGWLKIHTADVPVISVGNITTGGTGKTPLVIWLCKFLQQKEIRTAVLTRGYKTHTKKRAARTDEPAILAQSCPEAEVIINPDRVAAAAEAVNKFGAKVLIMDDGFQHRRLARDADIVTIDATQPFGYNKMLPAGLLREPSSALKRADAVVITRCEQADETQLAELEEKLQSNNPGMIIAKAMHAAICVKSAAGEEISIEQLKGKKIFAFCGIGNPEAFFKTIRELGAKKVGSQVFNDHYHYTEKDMASICEQARLKDSELVLSTEKDWTKIKQLPGSKEDVPFGYLVIELKFVVGEEEITRLIENSLSGKIASGSEV